MSSAYKEWFQEKLHQPDRRCPVSTFDPKCEGLSYRRVLERSKEVENGNFSRIDDFLNEGLDLENYDSNILSTVDLPEELHRLVEKAKPDLIADTAEGKRVVRVLDEHDTPKHIPFLTLQFFEGNWMRTTKTTCTPEISFIMRNQKRILPFPMVCSGTRPTLCAPFKKALVRITTGTGSAPSSAKPVHLFVRGERHEVEGSGCMDADIPFETPSDRSRWALITSYVVDNDCSAVIPPATNSVNDFVNFMLLRTDITLSPEEHALLCRVEAAEQEGTSENVFKVLVGFGKSRDLPERQAVPDGAISAPGFYIDDAHASQPVFFVPLECSPGEGILFSGGAMTKAAPSEHTPRAWKKLQIRGQDPVEGGA